MKAVLAPRIATRGVPGFLLWTRRDNPALYAAMVRALPEVAAFDQAMRDNNLGAFSLSALGSSLASSAKRIGAFVADNAVKVAAVALPIVVAKKQADIAKAQVKLAQLQAAPMQTATLQTTAGALAVPVTNQGGTWQQVPVDGGMIGAQVPMASGGIPWGLIAGAGGALVLLAALARR